MESRLISLVVVPGTGARQVSVTPGMTITDLVESESLTGRAIIVNGEEVAPDDWETTTLDSAVEVFATKAVKGA